MGADGSVEWVPQVSGYCHCTHCALIQTQHAFIEVLQMSRLIIYVMIYCCITKRSVISWQIVEVVPPATYSTFMEPCIDLYSYKRSMLVVILLLAMVHQ